MKLGRGPLSALLLAKLRISRQALLAVRRESRLKVALVSLFAVLFPVGLFAASMFGFDLFENLGAEVLGAGLDLGDVVMDRLLAVFALVVFGMLVLSNVLIIFTSLYRSQEMLPLIASPAPTGIVFLGRLVECVVLSSWASAYLGLPIMLAYGLESGAPASFYIAMAAFFPPFVALPAALAALVTLTLVRLLGERRRWLPVALGTGIALAIAFAVVRGQLQTPDLGDSAAFRAVIDTMERSQNPWFPSFWAARGVLDAAQGRSGKALFHWCLLTANAAFFLWLATVAAEMLFYRGWSALRSGGGHGKSQPGRAGRLLGALLRPIPEPGRSLMIKDLRLFWRDPSQWSQFVLFFGILALYVAQLDRSDGPSLGGVWGEWRTLLNAAAALLILATLTTRFVFPLISLEGRRFWILGLAPLSRRQLVQQKFWLSVALTASFSIGLMWLSGSRLGLDTTTLLVSLVTMLAASLGLSGLAVGLGCLYPSFDQTEPARIVSGMGGTLNFLLSLLYVGLVFAAEVVLLNGLRLDALLEGHSSLLLAAAAASLLLLTATACLIPMALGQRHLERAEI